MDIRNNYYIPYVIEQTDRGERSYDIYSRLLKDPDRFFWAPRSADQGGQRHHRPDAVSGERRPDKDINLYVNSPGGSVSAAWRSWTHAFRQARRFDAVHRMAASMGAVAAGRRRQKQAA